MANDERVIKSMELMNQCIGLLSERCDMLQTHIELLQVKMTKLWEANETTT